RRVRAALPLSRLAVGAHWPLSRTAVRRGVAPPSAVQGPRPDQGVCRRGEGGAALGLSRAAAGAAGPYVGAVPIAKRLRATSLLRSPLQLVPVPGELPRPGALRVAALQLDPRAQR